MNQTTARNGSFKWLGVAAAALLALQLIPYGRSHSNPPVQAQPAWDSPRTSLHGPAPTVTAMRPSGSGIPTWPQLPG